MRLIYSIHVRHLANGFPVKQTVKSGLPCGKDRYANMKNNHSIKSI